MRLLRRPNGSAWIRSICLVENCNSLQRLKGRSTLNGKKMYAQFCDFHHKTRYGIDPHGFFKLKNIANNKCERCDWEGPCDRDRLIPEKGYIEGNVQILCPNCHRLKSLNLIQYP